MHGVYFGKMAPKGSSGSHLNSANWLKLSHSLGQCGVTGLFPLLLMMSLVKVCLGNYLDSDPQCIAYTLDR